MQKNSPYYKLEVTKDGMEAYITLIDQAEFLNGKTEWTSKHKEEIKNIILKEIKDIIKIGLMEEQLIKVLNSEFYGEQILIAEGTNPIDGKDGYVIFNFDLDKELIPKVYEDGTVNYKELDIINNIKKGDILAELIPPLEGKDGFKVNGEIIKYRQGKLPNIRYGKNIELLEDGKTLVSKIDGLVELKGNKIVVSEILEINNLNKETGNIYFNGTIRVRENALNGFQIKAEGDVEVRGVVEGAYIENKGDIVIRRGIQGYSRPTIRTAGNITTRFVENAIINAGGNIVAEAIMHSKISCKGNINTLGKRGLIVGGIYQAGGEIKAKTIGSSMATSTILAVGTDPDSLEKKEKLKHDLEIAADNLGKINKSLNLLDNLKKSNRLDGEKIQMYLRLIKTRDILLDELKEKKAEYEEIEKSIENLSKGIIKVSDTIYPGVKIVIGNSSYYVKDEMKRCTFYREEGEIKIGPYRGK